MCQTWPLSWLGTNSLTTCHFYTLVLFGLNFGLNKVKPVKLGKLRDGIFCYLWTEQGRAKSPC